MNEYICPGCKTDAEHDCHSKQFGCNCPDCREYHSGNMEWLGRMCECEKCTEKRIIERFLKTFLEKQHQKIIYEFLKLKFLPEKREKIVESRN